MDIWKHIKVEYWRLFQQIKTMSPAKRKRDKAIESAKKNEHHHHLGQNDFNTAREIWTKDGFYLGSTRTEASSGTRTGSTSDVTIDVNRANNWFCAMHSKLELREKQIQGEFILEGDKDRLYYALGEKEDHPRRARGLGGVNISIKQAFGASTKAINNELREELRNDMMSFLRQMGLKLPDDRDISPDHPLINQPQPSLPSLVKET
ncbi:hypothetical protein RND81_05G062300 [Saponaria officinalis]|uniref:Uncharacterized protein n=1 Tax=Saponaria officinalis TaxID=3572 RepID=A0AAW1KU88_SAPOF